MKKVTLIVRQHEISKVFPKGFQLLIADNASTLDAIRAADKEIKKNVKTFQRRDSKVYFTWFSIPTKTGSTSKPQSKHTQSRNRS